MYLQQLYQWLLLNFAILNSVPHFLKKRQYHLQFLIYKAWIVFPLCLSVEAISYFVCTWSVCTVSFLFLLFFKAVIVMLIIGPEGNSILELLWKPSKMSWFKCNLY